MASPIGWKVEAR